MAKGLNLKATFSADTSDIKKGAKESQAAVKEFKTQAGSAMDEFAGLFGASIGQIGNSVKSFQGGLTLLTRSFQTTTASSGLLSRALGVLKVAFISTGIGAVVVALGSLVAYFKRSQDGVDALSRALAPLKVLFNSLIDIAASLGRSIYKAFQDPKQAIKDCWEAIKTNIVNRFVGLVDSFKGLGKVITAAFSFDWDGVKAGAKEVGSAMSQFTTGLDKQQRESIAKWMGDRSTETKKWMKESQTLADKEAALNKKKIAFLKEEANINAQLTKYREQSADREEYSAEERMAFSKKAEDLTRTLYAKRIELAREEYEIKKSLADLDNAVDLNSETEEVNQLYADTINLQADMNMEIRSLYKEQKRLTSEVTKEREERERIAKIRDKENISDIDPSKIFAKANASIKPINIKAKIDSNLGGANEFLDNFKTFKTDVIDISQEIKQAFAEIAVSVGESLGELIAGEGGWDNFSKKVASVMADLAITIGKIAIMTGITTLGITAALKSMNGYAAIAAGVALVALGTAVKSQLNSAANGTYGTYSSNKYNVSTSSGVSGSNSVSDSYESRVLTVKVSGTLKAAGNELLAVIANENKRKNLTT